MRADLPGTGRQFAAHLLRETKLDYCKIVPSVIGDHYDPATHCVALSEPIYNGRSLTAVVVAAHEVGHAIQDHIGLRLLAWRTFLVRVAAVTQKIGSMLMIAIPLVTVLARTPSAGAIVLIAGLMLLFIPVCVHLVTLPVEFDASFERALPILELGYLSTRDLHAARKILLACALTYVAASLAALLNIWQWLRMIRR